MMTRERYKQKPCEANSIEASSRGGQARSSEETTVIVVERRSLVTQLQLLDQLEIRRNQ
jgi:hypothetical protein